MGKQFSLKIKKLITNQIKSFVMIKQRRYKVLIPYQNVEGNYEFGNLLLLKHLPTARKIGSRTHAYMKEAMVRHSFVVYFPSSTIGPLPQREKKKIRTRAMLKNKNHYLAMPYGLKLFPSVLLPPSFRLELGFLCASNFDDDDDQLLSNYVKYFCEGWGDIYIYIYYD